MKPSPDYSKISRLVGSRKTIYKKILRKFENSDPEMAEPEVTAKFLTELVIARPTTQLKFSWTDRVNVMIPVTTPEGQKLEIDFCVPEMWPAFCWQHATVSTVDKSKPGRPRRNKRIACHLGKNDGFMGVETRKHNKKLTFLGFVLEIEKMLDLDVREIPQINKYEKERLP